MDPDRVGVYIGSGIGGLNTWEEQHRILLEKGPRRVSPFFIPMMIANMASGQVSIMTGAKGPNSAAISACATGTHAIGDAFRDHSTGRSRRHARRWGGSDDYAHRFCRLFQYESTIDLAERRADKSEPPL